MAKMTIEQVGNSRVSVMKSAYSDNFPNREAMVAGVVYVSKKHEIAIHLCACGCGGESVTPIDASGWELSDGVDGVSLSPSIQNRFKCRSHYFIKRGIVEWVRVTQ